MTRNRTLASAAAALGLAWTSLAQAYAVVGDRDPNVYVRNLTPTRIGCTASADGGPAQKQIIAAGQWMTLRAEAVLLTCPGTTAAGGVTLRRAVRYAFVPDSAGPPRLVRVDG